jgi:hypothetical protein
MPRPSNEVERDRAAAATEVDDPFEGRREWRESRRRRRKRACLAPRLRVRSSLRNMFIDRSCKSQRASGCRAARRRVTSARRDRKGGKGKERHPRRPTYAHREIVGYFFPGFFVGLSTRRATPAGRTGSRAWQPDRRRACGAICRRHPCRASLPRGRGHCRRGNRRQRTPRRRPVRPSIPERDTVRRRTRYGPFLPGGRPPMRRPPPSQRWSDLTRRSRR